MRTSAYTPNDPLLSANQNSLFALINAYEAWDFNATCSGSQGSGDIVIAIIDNAVKYDQEDIKTWINSCEIPGNGLDDDNNGFIDDIYGWDFGDEDNDPRPANYTFVHGTHPFTGIAV